MWYFYYYVGLELHNGGASEYEDTLVYSHLINKPPEKNKKSWFEVYDDYGGFSTIEELMGECKSNNKKTNDEYHFSEIRKYEILRDMQENGLIAIYDEDGDINKDYIAELTKMTLNQLQRHFQLKIKETFINVNAGDYVVYNLTEDILDAVEELDAGEEMGLPFYKSPRLNKRINGQKRGNLIYLVMPSGVGKSSFISEKVLLSSIEEQEPIDIFVNEEGKKRWQANLLTVVASRKLKGKALPRDIINRGRYKPEHKETVLEAARWIKENNQDENIKLTVLKRYRVEDVISEIELMSKKQIKHFILDTFKPDNSSQEEARWLAFANSAQQLYDCIKEETNNVSLLASVQMKIGKQFRYLDLESIGKSLEIVEVAAVVLAGRMLFADECEGGKNPVVCYDHEWNEIEKKWDKKKIILSHDKQYLILFIPKNREGSVKEQIIYENVPEFNIWREIGYACLENTGANSDRK